MVQHPASTRTNHLEKWDLVWDHAQGLGLVVACFDGSCSFRPLSFSRRKNDEGAYAVDPALEPPEFRVSWVERGLVEVVVGPLGRVDEQLKCRDRIESAIASAQDPCATAVEIGYATLLLEDAPRVFAVASALKNWGCAGICLDRFDSVARWVSDLVYPIANGYLADTMRKTKRRHDYMVGRLANDPSVLARILFSSAEADFGALIEKRMGEEREELLAKIEIALAGASTTKGIEGARRRFISGLLTCRRRYGSTAKEFWDRVKREGEEAVIKALQEGRQ